MRLSVQECGHLFEQGLMFEIGEFTRIKIQTMLGAGFVANMRLVGILDVFHRFAASWAGAISDGVIGFTGFGIACPPEDGPPRFKPLSLLPF